MKQQAKKKVGSITEPGFAGTNPQKVKQEIQKDVAAFQNALLKDESCNS